MAKKKRITKDDWDKLQSSIKKMYSDRSESSYRKRAEAIWKCVDAQVAMEPPTKVTDGTTVDDDWHNAVELGELSKASEVLSADIRRLVFPHSRAWFEPHINIDGDLNEQTGQEHVDPKQQKEADGTLRSLMAQQHQDFGLKARVDLSVKEALHHGSFCAEVREESMSKFHGSKVDDIRAPAWVPHSMWNTFPDPSPTVTGAEMFYGGIMILRSFMQMGVLKKQTGPGWMTDRIKQVPKRTNKNKDVETEDVELIIAYGDMTMERKGENIYLPNTKSINANGIVVYHAENKTPYSPIIFSGYEKLDIRDPYYISPIIKQSPMQTLATEMVNKFMDSVALNNEPPMEYDANDPQYALNGGPKIYPGATNGKKGGMPATMLAVGSPEWAMAGFNTAVAKIQEGTSVSSIRAGMAATTEQTATEVLKTSQGAEIRTVDFVDKLESQGLRPFLYLQEALNKKFMGSYSFYNPEIGLPDFVILTKKDLPKEVHFEIVGSKGLLGEEQRTQRMSQVTSFLLGSELTAGLINTEEVARQMFQDAGIKNPERFLTSTNGGDPAMAAMQQQMQEMQAQFQEILTGLHKEMNELNMQIDKDALLKETQALEKQQWAVQKEGMQATIQVLNESIRTMEEQQQLIIRASSIDSKTSDSLRKIEKASHSLEKQATSEPEKENDDVSRETTVKIKHSDGRETVAEIS